MAPQKTIILGLFMLLLLFYGWVEIYFKFMQELDNWIGLNEEDEPICKFENEFQNWMIEDS